MVDMDMECNRLDEAAYDQVSSEDHLAPGLVGRGWSGVLGILW